MSRARFAGTRRSYPALSLRCCARTRPPAPAHQTSYRTPTWRDRIRGGVPGWRAPWLRKRRSILCDSESTVCRSQKAVSAACGLGSGTCWRTLLRCMATRSTKSGFFSRSSKAGTARARRSLLRPPVSLSASRLPWNPINATWPHRQHRNRRAMRWPK
eukprot:Rmarinus@m.16468